MEWHIIGILVFVVIYNIYRYYHEDADKDLLFSVLEMPNGIWEFTERKHVISYDEYLRVCEKIK